MPAASRRWRAFATAVSRPAFARQISRLARASSDLLIGVRPRTSTTFASTARTSCTSRLSWDRSTVLLSPAPTAASRFEVLTGGGECGAPTVCGERDLSSPSGLFDDRVIDNRQLYQDRRAVELHRCHSSLNAKKAPRRSCSPRGAAPLTGPCPC